VRVIEEIGELGEAVRLLPLTRRFFLNEASDVFAWLMAEANQLLHDASNESTEDFRVEALLWNEYPGLCHFCGREQCKCSPIPPHTLGRISTETPPSAFRPERGEPLFGPEDALAFFQVGMETISIADQQVTLTLDALAELDETLRGVINELERKSERTDASLIEILGRLQAMASAHQVSEEEFQALEADLSSLQPGAKSSLIEILNGMASGIWTEILLRLLQ
jgi:hypothetical protein